MWNSRSNGGFCTSKKVKIKLFGKHFAWINEDLLHAVNDCIKGSRVAWIKQKVQEDFELDLKGVADLLLLDKYVKKSFYLDKTDWLRTKMREEIKKFQDD